jgi:hypothetical protein
MASKETDQYTHPATRSSRAEGTSLKSALDVARKFGAVRDSVLPVRVRALYDGDTKTFYALASQLKILTYFNLGTTIGNWKTWLATKGPILTRLDVDDDLGRRDRQQRQHGRTTARHTRGGHCVAMVGYRKDRIHRPQQLGHELGRQGLRLRVAGLRAGGLHRGLRHPGLTGARGA